MWVSLCSGIVSMPGQTRLQQNFLQKVDHGNTTAFRHHTLQSLVTMAQGASKKSYNPNVGNKNKRFVSTRALQRNPSANPGLEKDPQRSHLNVVHA
jgi:hypothetical protein